MVHKVTHSNSWGFSVTNIPPDAAVLNPEDICENETELLGGMLLITN